MKIIFLDWKCFHRDETINALKGMGHDTFTFYEEGHNDLNNDRFSDKLLDAITNIGADAVFSYNYFPLVAEACNKKAVPYISFIYDSPYVYIYSYTLPYETNHVFLFDRSWVNEFRSGGIKNVRYMVLPGDPDRVERMPGGYDASRCVSDLSFVGALYNERHNFYERLEEKLTPYLKGYLEGIIESQQKLYGMSIVEPLLSPDILKALKECFLVDTNSLLVEPDTYRYANYFIKRKITQIERIKMLTELGETFGSGFDLKLFTLDDKFNIPGIKNMGITPYETEMPYVFRNSGINLNITLRSIDSGIPLRCMDIMSCGGFLLCNYQSDLVTDFAAGEEFVYFADIEDLLAKSEYYLTHEKERREIAINGRERIRKDYNFKITFEKIFEIAFGV